MKSPFNSPRPFSSSRRGHPQGRSPAQAPGVVLAHPLVGNQLLGLREVLGGERKSVLRAADEFPVRVWIGENPHQVVGAAGVRA
jgi:hypothetical protein